jgi:hypothetical protein
MVILLDQPVLATETFVSFEVVTPARGALHPGGRTERLHSVLNELAGLGERELGRPPGTDLEGELHE